MKRHQYPQSVLFALIVMLGAGRSIGAYAQEDSEPAEPVFTQRAFLSSEIELEAQWDQPTAAEELGFTLGYTKVLDDRWQLGIEIPYVFRNPDTGGSTSNLSDIELSIARILPLGAATNEDCQEQPVWCFSVSAEVALPTGDDDKEIGGGGEWGTFIRAGRYWGNAGVHLQFGYEQQIDLTAAQEEEADELGVSRTREKELVWNFAYTRKLNSALSFDLEVLGTTILDAIESDEEGTIVEFGGGASYLLKEGLTLSAGVKFPITSRRESTGTALIRLSWEMD